MMNRFGSTTEMVIQEVEENGILHSLAIDSKGLYLTQAGRLDSGFADPLRYASNRAEVTTRLSALGLDPAALLSANQHLIKVAAGDSSKKVNPLKASKRAMKK